MRTNFFADLVPAVQRALAKSEATFIIPTADLQMLINWHYDDEDEIADLETEVEGRIKQVEGGEQ